jgi:hypothetical protein
MDFLAPGRACFFPRNRRGALGGPEMLQRLLQVLWRIEVVLKKKLHGPLASFTALSHAGNDGPKSAFAKGNNGLSFPRHGPENRPSPNLASSLLCYVLRFAKGNQ